MKKTVALVTLAALSISMLAGCGSKNNATKESSKSSDKFSMSMTVMAGPKKPDSWLEQELRKKLGVDLKFIMLPGWEEKNVKTNLMMQDENEMPDILWFNGQEKEFQQWIDAGLIRDMGPYLKKAPDKNILKSMDAQKLFKSYDNGKIYKLPTDISGNGSTMSTFIRQDWLDKLNLKVPTNINEMVNVLRAFTNNDPDGNGKKDTWGFAGANEGSMDWRNFAPMFYSFGYDPDSFDVKDGVVTYGAVLPEMKEALTLLRDMYKEGLIHPKTFEKNNFEELIAQGQMGMFYRWQAYADPENQAVQALKSNIPTAKLQAIDPIKGKDGFSGDYPEPPGSWCYVALTKKSSDPQKVVDVLDKMMSPEIKMLAEYGEEGKHYKIENGKLQRLINDNQRNDLGLGSLGWIAFGEETIPKKAELKELADKRVVTADKMRERKVYFKASSTSGKMPTWKENGTAISDMFNEVYLGIITGQKDISEFDKFVDAYYNKFNGKQIEKELTELWKAEQKEYKEWDDLYQKEFKVEK